MFKCETTEPVMENPNTLLIIGGQSFHCTNLVDSGDPMRGKVPCCCNVFQQPTEDPDLYECNSCGTRYRATKK